VSREPIRYRPNPLAAWFLLLTALAALCSFVGGAFATRQDPLLPLISGGILAAVFAAVGSWFRPHFRNAGIGFISGGMIGCIFGVLIAAKTSDIGLQAFAVIVGSVMIVLVGLLGRSVR
jgi:hypothetical protein